MARQPLASRCRRSILLAVLLAGCAGTAPRTVNPPQAEAPKAIEAGAIRLPWPSSAQDAAYLGLTEPTDSFPLDRIRADVLVIEVFDMYCRFCQATAPRLNQVYERIQHSGFGDTLKIIGIGRMNTALEVATFRGKYKVPFPMFPDKDLSIIRALNAQDASTPHFIVVKMEEGGRGRVVTTLTGTFEDPKAFYNHIIQRSGLKKEDNP